MASIRIYGIDDLQRKLGQAASNQILRQPMHRAVNQMQRQMQVYPVQNSTSSYARTGTLGRRWTTKVTSSAKGVVGIVGNNVNYAQYVQSERFQAWMHKGRWTNTDEKTVERNRDNIIRDFQQAIDRALDGK